MPVGFSTLCKSHLRPGVVVDMWDDLIRYERLPAVGEARRRVLHVTNMWPDPAWPHYGSFIASQARSLPPAGIDVDLVYVRGHLGGQAYLKALVDLPRAGRRRPYDLVHIHYGHTAAAGIGILRRPLVVSFCGEDLLGAPTDDDGLTLKSRVEVALFRQLARTATMTITKSQEMEAVLPAVLRPRNRVLPNGVDMEMFAPRPRAAARAELGWAAGEKVVLFLGNAADPRKNVNLAREGVALLAAECPEVRLHEGWGVKPDQVPVLMNAADCLVFTSRSEGSPNVIKEAMACELPIVATPVGDVRERLDGVEHCFVRDPVPEEFAAALRLAIDCDRAPAARIAVQTLASDAVAGRLEQIYAEAEAIDGR